MIRNVYFKSTCCNEVETRYIDDKFVDVVKKNLKCSCGKNRWIEVNELSEKFSEEATTGKLVDHRAYDKNAYMSSDYKTKRSQINDFHREKTGFSKFRD